MAGDIKTVFNPSLLRGEYEINPDGSLLEDTSLETAVILSLFSDARAAPGDELPGNDGWRRGWWGDNLNLGDTFGSRLWLLNDRGKLTQEAVNLAEKYVKEALEWLIKEGIASSVRVQVEPQRTPANSFVLAIFIEIKRGDVVQLSARYAYVWQGVN